MLNCRFNDKSVKNMATVPDYMDLQQSLHNVDATMEASEAQGALCGMLCAQGHADVSQWQQHVFGSQETGDVLLKEVASDLKNLFISTEVAINDSLTDFQLLLADDDEKLADRVHALAYWVQGFLYGLAVGGIKQGSSLPKDTTELMLDFINISQAVFDDEEMDSSEDDYMQLVEFVRVGVLLINEELQPMKRDTPVITESLH